MRKCIMVKVRGKRNTHVVCKKQVNFSKTGGKFLKIGGNNNSERNRGKCTGIGKIGGIRNLWSMTKKRLSKILADENREIFRERQNVENFRQSLKFFRK